MIEKYKAKEGNQEGQEDWEKILQDILVSVQNA